MAASQEGNGADLKVFMANEPQPEFPSTGLHALEVSRGEVIDIIVQNTPGSAFNGDYRCSPTPLVACVKMWCACH